MKVLWLSLCPPYSKIKHAGGQALYKHVSSFLKEKNIEIKMITLGTNEDKLLFNNTNPKLEVTIIDNKSSFLDYESRWNPYNRNGGYISNTNYLNLKKAIKKLNKSKYKPDLIILNWTELLTLEPFINNIYPRTKIVAIEEDVAFVKRKRRISQSKNKISKIYNTLRFKSCLKKEIGWLQSTDIVAVYNSKDKERLIKNGIKRDKIFVFSPVFANKRNLEWKRENNDIVFWGAMSRKENYNSAIWFIDNVLPNLKEKNYRFVVVGANPPKILQERESISVHVTGYVDSPDKYFENSMCLVVPLQIGAGIKIKVLEGLSSGIPVISNHIGIEGIPAVNEESYLAAESAEDFVKSIKMLENEELSKKLSIGGKKLIYNYYDEEKSTLNFINKCKEIVNG